MYTYQAKFIRAVDGDTIDVALDLGFHVTVQQRLRLARIDTAEKTSKVEAEVKAALAAQNFVEIALSVSTKPLRIQTQKTDRYGRYLAEVFYTDKLGEQNLSDRLLAEQHAKPYVEGK